MARYKRIYPRDAYPELEVMTVAQLRAEWAGTFGDRDHEGMTRVEIIDTLKDYRSDQESNYEELMSMTRKELIEWADAWGYDFRRSATKAEIAKELRRFV